MAHDEMVDIAKKRSLISLHEKYKNDFSTPKSKHNKLSFLILYYNYNFIIYIYIILFWTD